jgi:hypothetical protein
MAVHIAGGQQDYAPDGGFVLQNLLVQGYQPAFLQYRFAQNLRVMRTVRREARVEPSRAQVARQAAKHFIAVEEREAHKLKMRLRKPIASSIVRIVAYSGKTQFAKLV